MSLPPAKPTPDLDKELGRAVAERSARRDFWLKHGERSLAQNLAMIGALGWLVITPTLVGVFAGQWLDHRLNAGIFWTGGLIVAGLAIGCSVAWRRVQDIQREDDP